MLTGAGYDVLTAAGGMQAVELLEKKHNQIDLTIVDLGLPDINGFEIIGAISRRANQAKIIAVTGVYKDIHLEMSQTVGAHAAIRKPPAGRPIQDREWLRIVRSLIGDGTHEKSSYAVQGSGTGDDSEPSNATREEKR